MVVWGCHGVVSCGLLVGLDEIDRIVGDREEGVFEIDGAEGVEIFVFATEGADFIIGAMEKRFNVGFVSFGWDGEGD